MKTAMIAFLATGMMAAGAAGDVVVVTAQLDIDTPDGNLYLGDVATLTLSMAGNGRQGVCAVEVTLACPGDAIQIRSVDINPAFSLVFEESEEVLPASSFRTVRAQPLATLDRGLAARGQEVQLATVEVEVTSAETFSSALLVNVRAVTIGRWPHPVPPPDFSVLHSPFRIPSSPPPFFSL